MVWPTLKRTPHIVSKRTRAGIVWYVYAWRGGPQVHRSEGPKRPRIDTDIARRIGAADEADNSPDPTTLLAVIRDWRRSPEWAQLADTTKKTWGSALDRIEEKWGDVPLAVFDDRRMKAKVFAWRDSRKTTPRAADMGVTVLRALLKFGVQRGRLSRNVAADIPCLYRNGQRAEIIWLQDDLERFAKAANTAVNDAVRLACLTGLRCADLADLRWSEVGEQAIIRIASKASRGKRRRATVPMTSELRDLLQALRTRPRKPNVDTVLVTSDGNKWSSDGLGKRVGDATTKAGIVHIDGRKKHLHDCRGTFATHLMLTGATDEDIARQLAWSPERVASIRTVYIDQARTVVALADRLAAKAVN